MNNHGDSILILGGGTMQGPAIAASQRLGLITHVADGNAHCPGAATADYFHHVDLRDLEGLLACAREISQLRGVFTAGTDFSSSVAWITEHLGLPGIPFEVSRAATHKGIMRDRLAAAGVPVPRYRVIAPDDVSGTRIEEIVHQLTLPVVCKPVDNMGARGVRRVASWDEIGAAVEESARLSVSNTAIVEELIPGDEYSLDALVIDGVVAITGVARRHIFFPPWFVELGHTIPAPLSEPEQSALERTFADAIRAIGITHGAAKGDIFLASDPHSSVPRVTVGEIAARLSGGYMSGWTYPASSGVPLTELGVEIALGRSIDRARVQPTRRLVSVERAVISAPGVVSHVKIADELGEPPRLNPGEEIFVTCAAGDTVSTPTNNVEKVANIICVGRSVQEAETRAAYIRSHVAVMLRPHNPTTDRFVFDEGWRGPWAHYELSPETVRELQQRPMIEGDLNDLAALIAAGNPVPIRPLLSDSAGLAGRIAPRHLSVDGVESLDRFVNNGTIEYADDAPRADGLFWKAFVSSGLQGVRYMVSCLATPRGGSA
ncbi:MAG: ATP-grasp domain-containing protein [Alkalispirochaeta sp.]